jgi:hypothetical protein
MKYTSSIESLELAIETFIIFLIGIGFIFSQSRRRSLPAALATEGARWTFQFHIKTPLD